jgi:hypothetical protein
MNPESQSDRTCDACDTRIRWGPILMDSGHKYYHRAGACQCAGRKWHTTECGSHWMPHRCRDEPVL